MTWIDRKDEMDTSGGRLKAFHVERQERIGQTERKEKSYSVGEAASMLGVNKKTIMKWLNAGVIPRGDGWFKLPLSGHIRIFGSAISKIQRDVS